MKIKKNLNIALLIIGISIVILGTVLFFTVPGEVKESFIEMHAHGYAVRNGEWGDRSGSSFGPGRFDHTWNRTHGGFWFLPVLIFIFILFFVLRKRGTINYSKHRRDRYMKNPLEILRSSYAEGRMTREEYLERKKILEQEEEL